MVFNTTMLESGFYMELHGHRLPSGKYERIYYDDIEGMWRYMYNEAIDFLIECDALDHYGRMILPHNEITHYMRKVVLAKGHSTWWPSDGEGPPAPNPLAYEQKNLGEILINQIVDNCNGDFNLPDWIKLYPRSLVSLPLRAIGEIAESRTTRFPFKRRAIRDASIDIAMEWLAEDEPAMNIYYDTVKSRYVIELVFYNQFGNEVTLVILSNTNRTDEFVDQMSIMANPKDIIYTIGRCKALKNEHKLLLTIQYKERKENCNDYIAAGKDLPQEDNQVGEV